MKLKITLPILFILFTAFLPKVNEKASIDEVRSTINNILSEKGASTKVSVFIYNPMTSDTIYSQNIAELMIPASNVKLFTTATALEYFGTEHSFNTKIYSSDVSYLDGKIEGDLYIKGFGNSLFNIDDLEKIADEIKEMGVKEITGNIIGDDSYFDNNYYREEWIEDEGRNVPLPPVSALVLNRNIIRINLSASKTGTRLRYTLDPSSSFISVQVNAKSTSKRTRPTIKQKSDEHSISLTINGGMRRNSSRTYSVNIENPPLFSAIMLCEKLNDKGIKIKGTPGFGEKPENTIEIASSGAEIGKVISLINKNSDNFLAECLFKSLGAHFSNEEGNSFYATQSVLTYLNKNNLVNEQISIVDGSGISRYNEVTTGSIIALLEKIYLDEKQFESYYNSLSIAGVDGTLGNRLYGTFAENNFHAKTGTLRGVSSLSGFVKSKSGEDLIISILMEFNSGKNTKYKQLQDEIVEYIAEKL